MMSVHLSGTHLLMLQESDPVPLFFCGLEPGGSIKAARSLIRNAVCDFHAQNLQLQLMRVWWVSSDRDLQHTLGQVAIECEAAGMKVLT